MSHWDTSNVGNMKSVFENSDEFDANFPEWVATNVVDMECMLRSTTEFNRNLCWDESGVYTNGMFTDSSGSTNC